MVWAAFCARGKTELVLINGNLYAQKYTDILDDTLLSFMVDMYKRPC